MSPITQQPWKIVGIWLALMLVVGAVSFIVWDGPRFIILSRKAATAKGTISSVDKKNHGSVVVIYNVDGVNHQATFSPYNRNVGDEVSVYHDPINPNISVIEDPIDLFKECWYRFCRRCQHFRIISCTFGLLQEVSETGYVIPKCVLSDLKCWIDYTKNFSLPSEILDSRRPPSAKVKALVAAVVDQSLEIT